MLETRTVGCLSSAGGLHGGHRGDNDDHVHDGDHFGCVHNVHHPANDNHGSHLDHSLSPLRFRVPAGPGLRTGHDSRRRRLLRSPIRYVRPASDPITGVPLLMDDLAGGLLYQTDGDAIWWQEAGEAEARVIVQAGAGESLTLQDVVVMEGGVEIWFTRDRGSTIDDYVVSLERMAVTGGSASVVGEIGSWESSSTATVGGEVIALETDSEGYHGFGVRNLDLGQIPQRWIRTRPWKWRTRSPAMDVRSA